MKSLINIFNDIIVEKLKLNNNSQIQDTPKSTPTSSTSRSSSSSGGRDLSNTKRPLNLINCFNKTSEKKLAGHVKKMEYYHGKGSTPKTLVNTIKDPVKLVIRFTMGVLMGWEGCWDVFRQAIIDRNIGTADEVDKFILIVYQDRSLSYTYGAGFSQNMQKSLKSNIEKYLNKYNIKY